MLAYFLLFIEKMAHLILASSSPRRKELLSQVGLNFEICSPDIDESVLENEQIGRYVERFAAQKAQAVLGLHPESIVIAADTSLVFADQIIGKPESKQHAFDIWTLLSGQKHEVLTGVCVANAKQLLSVVVRTEVEFQFLSSKDMEEYWATGEPIGKAGGYAIQGFAAKYVKHINGSYSNVVGLPLHETIQLLDQIQQGS